MRRTTAALCLLAALGAQAQTGVTVSGVMGDKAVLSVNGAAPRVLRVGESLNGVQLVEVGYGKVVVQMEGRRYTLGIRQGVHAAAPADKAAAAGDSSGRVQLTADGQGHFTAQGSVNGVPVRFMVDTGASLVALPEGVARRAGVDLDRAPAVTIQTANGRAPAHRVVLNNVTIDGISLHLVEALVVDDAGLSTPLLGMSFLNRTNMHREGDSLVLIQRY